MFDEGDLALKLALGRTILAYERTYTAWIRTGLGSFAAGIGAKSLLDDDLPQWSTLGIATALLLFSAFCFQAAASCERRVAGLASGELPRLPGRLVKGLTYGLTVGTAALLVAMWIT